MHLPVVCGGHAIDALPPGERRPTSSVADPGKLLATREFDALWRPDGRMPLGCECVRLDAKVRQPYAHPRPVALAREGRDEWMNCRRLLSNGLPIVSRSWSRQDRGPSPPSAAALEVPAALLGMPAAALCSNRGGMAQESCEVSSQWTCISYGLVYHMDLSTATGYGTS